MALEPNVKEYVFGSELDFLNKAVPKYIEGDFGTDWSGLSLNSDEGWVVVANNTNATAPGKRLYIYANGSWHYVSLT